MGKNNNSLFLLAGGITLAFILSNSGSKKDMPKEAPKTAASGKPTDFIIKMAPYAKEAVKSFPQVPYELVTATLA